MRLTRINTEIAHATLRILSRIGSDDRENTTAPVGGVPCLYDLIQALQNEFMAAAVGFLWLDDNSAGCRLCVTVPSAEERLVRECLKVREIKTALDTFIKEPKRKYIWRVPDSKRSPFTEFIAIRVPLFHEWEATNGLNIICIVDRLVRSSLREIAPGTEIEPFCYIVTYWAARMVHRRMKLRGLSERCRKGLGGANTQAIQGALLEATRTLRRTLTLGDYVAVTEALELTRGATERPALGCLPESLVNLLNDWRHCAPPRWPPKCGACRVGRPVVSHNLAKWTTWRNVDASDIRDHREDLVSKISRLLRRLNSTAREALKPEVNLLPRGLHAFVLSRCTDPFVRQRMAFWKSAAPTDDELAKAVTSVARVLHHVLGGLPIDDKTIQGIVWLLREYGHHALGVPEQIDLRAHLLQAARGEPALHVLKSFYRDHFFHAIEVCFLGHFLLELQVAPSQTMWKLVAKKLNLSGRIEEKHRAVLRLWYVASLLHDVGYGIDVLKGLQSLLRFFGHTEPLRGLSDRLSADLKQLSKDLEKAGLADYSSADEPGEDHGVIAAWHLENLLRTVEKHDKTVVCREYWPAIRAIARHNSRKHDVVFSQDPLAFLLILCDTIQEWNRPRFSFATSPIQILSRLLDVTVKGGEWASPLEAVCLNVKRPKARTPSVLDPSGILQFTLTFNDLIRWNAGVFNLWLDASCNLQRLNFKGLPSKFTIDIQYKTPLFQRSPGALFEQQFYRLRDATNETHITFLDRWFPQAPVPVGRGNTNGAVTWVPGEVGGAAMQMESLTLHVRKLSEIRPIAGSIDEFRKRLPRWRRFNEDREFEGDYGTPETVV